MNRAIKASLPCVNVAGYIPLQRDIIQVFSRTMAVIHYPRGRMIDHQVLNSASIKPASAAPCINFKSCLEVFLLHLVAKFIALC